MTALIIIGIIIASLVTHFTIGGIAALKMSSKVAELSYKVEEKSVKGDGYYEYEWESNYSSTDKEWRSHNWMPGGKKGEVWKKTGRKRYVGGAEPSIQTVIVFDPDFFRGRMNFIRWFWFFGVPATLNGSIDKKMIERYDPHVAELKEKQLQSRIAELEADVKKELER